MLLKFTYTPCSATYTQKIKPKIILAKFYPSLSLDRIRFFKDLFKWRIRSENCLVTGNMYSSLCKFGDIFHLSRWELIDWYECSERVEMCRQTYTTLVRRRSIPVTCKFSHLIGHIDKHLFHDHRFKLHLILDLRKWNLISSRFEFQENISFPRNTLSKLRTFDRRLERSRGTLTRHPKRQMSSYERRRRAISQW